MKKIIILLSFMMSHFFNLSAQDSKLTELFNQFDNKKGITSIKVSNSMFGLLTSLDIEDKTFTNLKPVLGKLEGLRILIADGSEEEGSVFKSNLQDVKNGLSDAISKLNFKEVMKVNSGNGFVQFLSSGIKDGYHNDLLMKVGEGKKSMLIMFEGKVSSKDLEKIVEESSNNKPITTEVTTTTTTDKNGLEEAIRNLPSFNSITASTGVKVQFTQSDTQAVVVQTEKDKSKYIKTIVDAGVLKISIETPKGSRLNINNPLVIVKAPNLKLVKTSSGSSFTTTREVIGHDFKLEASSGSNLKGKFVAENMMNLDANSGSNINIEINSPKTQIEGTSGSSITLQGRTDDAIYKTSSAASVNAQNLKAKNVVASASSAASLKLHAAESLNVVTSSGGSIKYEGKPNKMVSSNDGGGSTKPIK